MQALLYPGRTDRRNIPVTANRSVLKSYETKIVYLQADNNYSIAYLSDQSHFLVCETLKTCKKVLDTRKFYRCHRSYLVNTSFIKTVPFKNNSRFIRLAIGTSVPLAKRKKTTFKKFVKTHLPHLLDT
jgi:DNA-binding LytR/AlgR family response regulator